MSTLDDIAKERQLLAERLAKLDGERAKLAGELAELEAAERVLSRFTQARPARRGGGAAASEAKPQTATAAEPRRGRRGRRAASKAAPKASRADGVSLGDAALRAVAAHGGGASAEEVRRYIAEQLGIQVRPNHLGMALQRHRRAGRLEQRDMLWFSGYSTGAEAAAP